MHFFCRLFYLITVCFLSSFFSLSATKWHVKIDPDLNGIYDDTKYSASHVACKRPNLREGPVVVYTEEDGKHIFKTLGLGGIGFSHGVGVLQRTLKLPEFQNLDLNTSFSIVGDGLIGRLAAFFLKKNGVKDLTIYHLNDKNIPSFNATGIFYPEIETKEQEKEACETCKFYEGIPFAKRTLIIESLYIFSNVSLNSLARVNHPWCQIIDEEATLSVEDEKGGVTTHSNFYVYQGFSINPGELMKWLETEISEFPKKEGRISSYKELPTQYVFDCSGVGITSSEKGISGHLYKFSSDKSSIPTLFSIQKERSSDTIKSTSVCFNLRVVSTKQDSIIRFPLGQEGCPLIRFTQFLSHAVDGARRFTIGGTHYNEELVKGILGVLPSNQLSPFYHDLESLITLFRFSWFLGTEKVRESLKSQIQKLATDHQLDPRMWQSAIEGSYRFSILPS